MYKIFTGWFHRHFSNPEAGILVVTLAAVLFVILVMGHMLMPAFVGLVFAYLLDSVVERLTGWGCPHLLSVIIVFIGFVGLFLLSVLFLFPVLWDQLVNLVNSLPAMFNRVQSLILHLSSQYPQWLSADQLKKILVDMGQGAFSAGRSTVSYSLSLIPGMIEVVIYFVLVPFLVFFFLKDKDRILGWLSQYLPHDRPVIQGVWSEINRQMSNYVRGKVVEILIVGAVTTVAFAILHLEYYFLLGALVGLSVIIPYVGAVVVTIPIVLVAFFQWGWSLPFAYAMITYLVITGLDGNVLVPVLFSGATNLHPVAIMIALLVFGGLWGFWGVFFAIPLATVVNAILHAWPLFSKSSRGFRKR